MRCNERTQRDYESNDSESKHILIRNRCLNYKNYYLFHVKKYELLT